MPQTPPASPPAAGRTRGSATWVGVAIGAVVLVLILVFVIQNLHEASVHFITVHVRMPVGILVLAAAVAGGVVVLLVSLARTAQVRMVARRQGGANRRRAGPG